MELRINRVRIKRSRAVIESYSCMGDSVQFVLFIGQTSLHFKKLHYCFNKDDASLIKGNIVAQG